MKEIKKLYFSIREVSEMVGEKQHVLRYWESEFPELSPKKNRAGNRSYTEEDLEVVLRIRQLLRHDKYTIEGARQVMDRDAGQFTPLERPTRELLELRAFLQRMLKNV